MRAAEQVLGVAGGVRRAAARGDQDVLHVVSSEQRGDLRRFVALPVEETRQRIGLLGELALEM